MAMLKASGVLKHLFYPLSTCECKANSEILRASCYTHATTDQSSSATDH